MRNGDIAQVIKALQDAGAEITFELPGAWGSGPILTLSPADALDLLANPAGFVAAKSGVTAAEMEEWEAHGHIAKCAGVTKQGRPCRKCVSPNAMDEPADFVRRHRVELCHLHA